MSTRADVLVVRSTAQALLLHALLLGMLLMGWRWARPDAPSDRAPGAIETRMVAFGDLSQANQQALLGAEQAATTTALPKPLEAAEVITPTPQPVVETQPPPQPAPPKPVSEAQPTPVQQVKPTPTVASPKPAPVEVAKPVPIPTPTKPLPRPERTPPVTPAKAAANPSPNTPTPKVATSTPPKPVQPDLAAQAAAEAARMSRAADLAKQRAAQLADARSPSPGSSATPPGSRSGSSAVGGGQGAGQTNSGEQTWLDAVARAIEAKWLRPDGIPPGQTCPIRIRIIPGGEVISVTVAAGCPYSEEAKRSVEKAVRDASPLPFKGYEDVYSRDFTANFKPSR